MVTGITGGIGSGKSIISRILRINGCFVYDCDSEAKKIMVGQREVRDKIISFTGDKSFHIDGSLNTKYLAEKIFSDSLLRIKINEIVHNAVIKDIERLINATEKPFFLESAILSSSGLVKYCDIVWVIEAPYDLKIQRIKHRDNLEEKEIIQRMNSQNKEIDSIDRCKIKIIYNGYNSPLLKDVLFKIGKLNNIETLCLKKF